MLDQLRSGKSGIIAALATCYIVVAGCRVVVDQATALRDGRWKQRVTDLGLDEETIARRELGPVAPWIAAIREKTPPTAVIGVRMRSEHELEAPGWISSLRFLGWPRRILTPPEFLAHIDGDAAKLDGDCFGLQLTDDEPQFAERWRVVAQGKGWRLFQWIESP